MIRCTVKQTICLIAVCVLAVLILGGCFNQWDGNTATITIHFSGGAGRTINDDILARLSYVLDFSGPTIITVGPTAPGTRTVNVSVSPGDYLIMATALLDGDVYAASSKPTPAQARAGQQTPVTIILLLAWEPTQNDTPITDISLEIDGPEKDDIPDTTATGKGNFTINAVTWSPHDVPFKGGVEYTVTMTLMAKNGFIFNDSTTAKINGQIANKILHNNGKTVTLSYKFFPTDIRTVLGIGVLNQPNKMIYDHGNTLNLEGLVIQIIFDDMEIDTVPFSDFKVRNISTSPEPGDPLSVADNHNKPVTIKYGSGRHTVDTGALTVNRIATKRDYFTVNGTGQYPYNGSPKTVTVTHNDGITGMGDVTVRYDGSDAAPTNAKTYTVTFDVAEGANYRAANGFNAGTLTITKATPDTGDFTYSDLLQPYNGNSKAVTVRTKPGLTGMGNVINLRYNGSETVPSDPGTYAVTFDVADGTNYNAASDISAGTLIIYFSATATFKTWLSGQEDNDVDNPYNIQLYVNNLGSSSSSGGIGYVLNQYESKYVNLDLSGSTFTSIGNSAFQGCSTLTGIIIPNSVTSIESGSYNGAFSNCDNLTSVTIPNSVTNIGDYAFSYCTSLANITIPDSVTSIAQNTFDRCTSLTAINVDPGNKNFSSEQGVVYNKNKTTLVLFPKGKTDAFTMPNSVTSIGDGAYSGSTMTNIIIPNNITSIGNNAFSNCYNLTSVTIPNSVTSIGKYAFNSCYSLASISIPFVGNSSDYYYLDYIFGCTRNNYSIPQSLKTVIVTGGSIGDTGMEFCNCVYLTSIIIGNNVTCTFFVRTFDDCVNLTSITIGSGVNNISKSEFTKCKKLTEINVDSGHSRYSSEDGVVYDKNKTTLVIYPIGKTGSFTIPNSVTSVGDLAFLDCASLTSITISNNVTSIGSDAFNFCTGLKSVTIPNNVTSIGNYAFNYCTGLTSVIIGSGINEILSYTFARCNNLISVTFEKSGINIRNSTWDVSYSDPSAFFNHENTISLKSAYQRDGKGTYTRPNTTSAVWTKQ